MSAREIRRSIPWYTCAFREMTTDGERFLVPVEPFYTNQPVPRVMWERLVKELQRSLAHFSEAEIEEKIQDVETERARKDREDEYAQQHPGRNGYVYIIQGGEYFKIGLSVDPAKRIHAMNCKAPFPLQVRILLPSEDIDCLERELHTVFRPKRQRGEWFLLTEKDLEFIRSTYPTIDPSSVMAS
jgi:Meiotically up-regulated gene 113